MWNLDCRTMGVGLGFVEPQRHTDAQLLTYLKLANKRLGLLINFNVPLIEDGIRRVIL